MEKCVHPNTVVKNPSGTAEEDMLILDYFSRNSPADRAREVFKPFIL